ncbi:MFS transporter [Gemmiger sp.]|uniref:MFS transporter n=1 Tax=Gemmiger sp. TaxID=2049027 RepID=UPI002E797041|nr:glycoside-pentoside-hexuronide (GPH):cation symporter [Gemmiger sp.]MED9885630.1 glycoside-pentoside-hexuronide (GPH):cation symporter [Gemmiger sp.]
MAKTKTPSGLSMKHKIGYACGDLGGCMTFALMGSIVTRYYTNVLQVNTVVLATMLLVWNVWDAVNDPLMGALMDKVFAKHHGQGGKFRPWLLRSAPCVAITFIIFFTVPTYFKGVTMLVVLFFCKILYEGFYTMFNIPMGSMLSAMADTDGERAALSSARGFGSMIGNIIPMIIMPQLLAKFGDTSKAFGIGATLCAIVGFVFCMLHYAWTEERHVSVAPSENNDSVKLTDILNVFRVNRPFLALCIHGICICTMQYVSSTLGTYMYGDVLGNIGMMSMASAVSMPLGILALIITPKIADKVGLERMIRICLLTASAIYFVLFGALMVASVPAIAYMLISSIALGLASVSIYMQWGLVGEAIDYNEMITGKRTEGSIYGTFNLTRRIGQTVGNSAAVLALGWIGYQAGAATQTAGTLTGIKALVVLIPAIFILGSWIAFRFVWNITPDVRAKMAAFKSGKETPAAE